MKMPRGYVEISREKLENFLQACGFGRRTSGKEVVYVRHNHHYHSVVVKVYTSLPSGGGNARGAGQDAIRVAVAYESEIPYLDKTSFGIYKAKRVFRTGTEQDVLDRLYERMREAYTFSNDWLRRNWTRLPKGGRT
jgi:hypothetical protein